MAQMEFYRTALAQTEAFSSNVDNYRRARCSCAVTYATCRKRFPRGAPVPGSDAPPEASGSPRGGYPVEAAADGARKVLCRWLTVCFADDDSDIEDVDGEEHGEHDDDRDQPSSAPSHARNSSSSAAPVVSGKSPSAPAKPTGAGCSCLCMLIQLCCSETCRRHRPLDGRP